MTAKKYEHLGRAVMLAADLAQGVEDLHDTRDKLFGELCCLVGKDEANGIDKTIMTDSFPHLLLGEIITNIANTVAECDAGVTVAKGGK